MIVIAEGLFVEVVDHLDVALHEHRAAGDVIPFFGDKARDTDPVLRVLQMLDDKAFGCAGYQRVGSVPLLFLK